MKALLKDCHGYFGAEVLDDGSISRLSYTANEVKAKEVSGFDGSEKFINLNDVSKKIKLELARSSKQTLVIAKILGIEF